MCPCEFSLEIGLSRNIMPSKTSVEMEYAKT